MKKLVLILLVAGCATVPQEADKRCVEGMHEEHRDGQWRPKIGCRGEPLTCYFSKVTDQYEPLRWAADSCGSDFNFKVKKLYLE